MEGCGRLAPKSAPGGGFIRRRWIYAKCQTSQEGFEERDVSAEQLAVMRPDVSGRLVALRQRPAATRREDDDDTTSVVIVVTTQNEIARHHPVDQLAELGRQEKHVICDHMHRTSIMVSEYVQNPPLVEAGVATPQGLVQTPGQGSLDV
ncbi:hypothetical protein WCD58_24580 [Actinomycetospora sp. OC33-EN07]|uniref:Uncharacterized protein n=1 Tax=Actinomycetospora flava TaxID=3129232 RepID=A0ABU8MBC1_9PSEU